MRFTRRFLLPALTAMCCASAALAGSTWPESAHSMFADHKAYAVGDIVTVIVEEGSELSSTAGSNLSRTSATEGAVNTLDVPKPAGAPKVFPGDMPAVDYEGSRTFNGAGTYTLKDSIKTSLSAVVVEVLPNGNLMIEGSRFRESVDEKVHIRLSGIVRPEDITADNTVPSTAVAQAKVVFDSKGPVARSSRRGWLDRLIDYIWPF